MYIFCITIIYTKSNQYMLKNITVLLNS